MKNGECLWIVYFHYHYLLLAYSLRELVIEEYYCWAFPTTWFKFLSEPIHIRAPIGVGSTCFSAIILSSLGTQPTSLSSIVLLLGHFLYLLDYYQRLRASFPLLEQLSWCKKHLWNIGVYLDPYLNLQPIEELTQIVLVVDSRGQPVL